MQEKIYPIKPEWAKNANCSAEQYQEMYSQSLANPEEFWGEQAKKFITWSKPWDKVLSGEFAKGTARWFTGGELNASYNCLDRHLAKQAQQVAIIWQGDDPNEVKKITYQELYEAVCRFGNVLKSHGVKKGDRVCIYLPMIPEAAVAMLACARIGAIHSVVFAGFSANALQDRILDADCRLVITADESVRGGKFISLKAHVDKALESCPKMRTMIVVKRTGSKIQMKQGRDVWYHDEIAKADSNCSPTPMSATDPLFILYTSGSTGKPKGILHGIGGYLLYAAMTHHYVFNHHAGDIYWCTADVGWVTGHSYLVYGPLANGTTTLMFEGVPNYPSFARFWEIIDKHQVNTFYTAPTAIRALMREGDEFVKGTSRQSLRVLGTVGEPINPQVWEWYFKVVGEQRCPVVDTWWQTETGGILITPLPGATKLKPGSATLPFFGIAPAVMSEQGKIEEGAKKGELVITQPWPGQMLTIYGDEERYQNTYFNIFPGVYFAGDGVSRDQDGYYWITGRIDDVINVAGHRLGTSEIESALVQHPLVAEAAVVGCPHEIKGQGIYAYVIPMAGIKGDDALQKELIELVREQISPIATPDVIQFVAALPKTRSGKIMRRILRKIANNELDNLGDTSTLADSNVVDKIIAEKGI